MWSSLLLGVATGFLWAPCAGPILGLILTGAAIQGASVATTWLLLCYAAGAATSLALALLIGGKVFATMKRSLGAGEWVRRGLGVAVLAGVVAIAFGADTGVLSQVSYASTNTIEQGLIDKLKPKPATQTAAVTAGAPAGVETGALPVLGEMPKLDGATLWLNAPPLSREALRGKVVLVDFWTYSCINCLRSLPYIKAWADRYRDKGLVVIGVHAPEFAFEKDIDNVKRAVANLGVTYPVAIDNDYAIWRAFKNNSWPAHYFIDARGRIRHTHFGEGEYAESEKIIQTLLEEAGQKDVGASVVKVSAKGDEAAADFDAVQSPETYIGYARAERFVSPGGEVGDEAKTYEVPGKLALNDWGLVGPWTVAEENAHLDAGTGKIVLQLPRSRPASGAGPGPRRQAGPLQGDDRRQGAWRRPRRRRRRRRLGRGDEPEALPARPPEGRDHRPYVRDRVREPRRPGLRVHVRLRRSGGYFSVASW